MRHWLCRSLLVAVLVSSLGLFATCSRPKPTAVAQAPSAWAYVGWWQPDGWRTAPLAQLERVLFFELRVAANGEIAERHGWPEKWVDLQQALLQHATALDLTLTLFNPDTFNKLFSSPRAMQRLSDESVALASAVGVAGLQLDFEIYADANPAAIKSYRNFVRQLATRLERLSPARNLSVFFPMGGETQLYDAATLARVKHVVLQGYDAHWPGSETAGPVAPLNGHERVTWAKAAALGLALGVPKERLFLSFPLFGYEWPVQGTAARSATLGKGVSTSFAPLKSNSVGDLQYSVMERLTRHAAVRDPISASSYYQFQPDTGGWRQGWFEDAWSLERKMDFLADQQLGGVAFFMLGYDSGILVDHFMQRRRVQNAQNFPKVKPLD